PLPGTLKTAQTERLRRTPKMEEPEELVSRSRGPSGNLGPVDSTLSFFPATSPGEVWMRHKASVTVGGLALFGASVAYAVPDSCDTGGGFLEGDVFHRDLEQSDAFFVPDVAYDE